MVELVRRGVASREVARRFGVAHPTVLRWLRRAEGERLGRVDWSDRPAGRRVAANRTTGELESRVLTLRRELRESSALGEHGAEAIRRALAEKGIAAPCARTIGRILERCGALDGVRRVRRPPPAPGWYLPGLACGRAELDSFDVVEGLKIQDGPYVDVLTGISLHGSLASAWPRPAVTTLFCIEALLARWSERGMPHYVQFDNDTRFQGPHWRPDTVGRVVRLCLALGVCPVFAPPREHGFQAAIEAFNGRWQRGVWRRFRHASIEDVARRSAAYLLALAQRHAARIESAPERPVLPDRWTLAPEERRSSRIVFLRRTCDRGQATVLGRRFDVAADWTRRLVRAEVLLDERVVRFYALRRREPDAQPLLAERPCAIVLKPLRR